jgi:DnaJ like chaperone protein
MSTVLSRILAGARELSFGGPLGTLLELVARHLPPRLTRSSETRTDARHSVAFTIAVIALSAKMAKADGTVTRDEVAAFRDVFQVPPGEEEHVRLVFDIARRSTAGFDSYARQVGRLFADNQAVLEDLLGGLFHIALADGQLCDAEDSYLRQVAYHFGFDNRAYLRLRRIYAGAHVGDGEDPFEVLGIDPEASPAQIRAAYHQLVRDNHPDAMIARGLPPECIALATTRVARINAAHDRLMKPRIVDAPEAQPA